MSHKQDGLRTQLEGPQHTPNTKHSAAARRSWSRARGFQPSLTLSVQFRLELSWKLHFPSEQQKACKSFHSLQAETKSWSDPPEPTLLRATGTSSAPPSSAPRSHWVPSRPW